MNESETAAAELQQFLIVEFARRMEVDPKLIDPTPAPRTIRSGFAECAQNGRGAGRENWLQASDNFAVGLFVHRPFGALSGV